MLWKDAIKIPMRLSSHLKFELKHYLLTLCCPFSETGDRMRCVYCNKRKKTKKKIQKKKKKRKGRKVLTPRDQHAVTSIVNEVFDILWQLFLYSKTTVRELREQRCNDCAAKNGHRGCKRDFRRGSRTCGFLRALRLPPPSKLKKS
jgi:hypothetical protein